MDDSKDLRHLTPQQELFCQAYASGENATKAAVKAGYSEHTAQEQGSRLLSKVMICERVDELLRDRARAMRVTADAVLAEYHRIATVDIAEAFNEKGELRPIHEIPIDVRKAIAAVEVDELFGGSGKDRHQIGYTKKIKFWDKTKALQDLAKNLRLLTEKLEITGKLTLEQLVTGAAGSNEEDRNG